MANKSQVERIRQGVEGWNEWVRRNREERANLSEAYLSSADLSGADLSEADLSGADLSEANLSGVMLAETDLGAAHLRGANLRKAQLMGANLTGADLSGADLRKAALTVANLFSANLLNADFSGAIAREVIFANVDLSVAKGLENVEHYGPSTIGIDTLYKSHGKIPEVFLRGAGVPESFITYIGSLVGRPIEFYSCFISYSHADKAFARRLHDALQGRGVRCWLDEHQLLPGDNIFEEVDRGIRLWDKVLLCCSKASLSSWWVDNEINKAFTKEQTLMKERGSKTLAVIPLNLDGELFAWKNGKADEVRSRLAADFTEWECNHGKFEAAFERVVKALRTGDGGREEPPEQRL
jgi:hypothetical protein